MEFFDAFNGKYFKDLPELLQSKLQDATLRTFELDKKTPKSMMFTIFERLNTGGVTLNEMEIRNCIYNGSLLRLVKDLTEELSFVKVINMPTLSSRMVDRNLVLRFLAFYDKHYSKCKNGLKRFLNEFCEERRNINQNKEMEFRQKFVHAMKAAVTIFGNKGFRLRKEGAHGPGNWTSKVNAAVFQVLSVSFTSYKLEQLTRRADSIYEAYVSLVSEDNLWIDYTKTSTGDYSRIDYVFTIWGQQLKEAIGNEPANDPKRCFSMELKEELYKKQSKVCAICKQKISIIEDAVVDHIKHYWK